MHHKIAYSDIFFVADNVSPPAVGASSPNQPAESPASVVNTAEANNNTTTTNNDVPQNSPEVKNNNSTMNTPHSTPVESSNTASNTPNTNANNSANNTPNNSNNNETSPVPEANAMVFEKGKYTLEELAAAKKGGEIEITMKVRLSKLMSCHYCSTFSFRVHLLGRT